MRRGVIIFVEFDLLFLGEFASLHELRHGLWVAVAITRREDGADVALISATAIYADVVAREL